MQKRAPTYAQVRLFSGERIKVEDLEFEVLPALMSTAESLYAEAKAQRAQVDSSTCAEKPSKKAKKLRERHPWG